MVSDFILEKYGTLKNIQNKYDYVMLNILLLILKDISQQVSFWYLQEAY